MGDRSSLISDPFATTPGEQPFELGQPTTKRESLIGEVSTEDDRLQSGLQLAQQKSPELAARIFALQRKTGFPAELIERNLDDLERQAAVADFDAEAFRARSPLLAQWLASDAYHAALAKDDLDALGKVEHALTFGGSILRGVDSLQGMLYGSTEAVGEAVGSSSLTAFGREGRERNRSEADAYGQATSVFAIRGPWDLVQVVKETVGEQLPIMGPPLAGAGLGFAAAGPIGAAIGAFLPSLAMGIGEVQGSIKDIDPHAQVPAAAFIGGSAIAAFDSVLPGKIGGRLVATFGRETAEQIARRALLAPVHPKYLRQGAASMATEGLTESLQEAIGAVAAAAGTDTAVPDDLWRQMVEAGARGAIVGGVIAGGEAGVTRRRVNAQIVAAKQNQVVFDALAEGVAESKLFQRLPAKAQAFVEAVTKNGPLETVFAPLDTWTTYWQSKGIDPAIVAAEITGRPDALEQARTTGEDLAIPTGVYAAKLAASEHHAFFAQELRLGGPERLNAREAAALEQELDAAVAAPAAEATDPIAAAVADQATAVGTSPTMATAWGRLHAAVFGTMGARAGVDPVARFAGYGVEISREGFEATGTRSNAFQGESGRPADLPPSVASPKESGQQRATRRRAHRAALESFVITDAQAIDPTVDVAELRRELAFRLDMHEEGRQEARASGKGQDLLRAIAERGGLWMAKDQAERGEFARWLEHRDGRVTRGGEVKFAPGRATWNGIEGVFREGGRTLDDMVRSLVQDPRFAYLDGGENADTPDNLRGDLNLLIDAIEDALVADPDPEDAFPGTAELHELGIALGSRWWSFAGESTVAAPERFGPLQQPLGPTNANGEAAYFIGVQEGIDDIPSMPLFNVVGGPHHGTTVGVEELEAWGIAVPPVPEASDSIIPEGVELDDSFDFAQEDEQFNQAPADPLGLQRVLVDPVGDVISISYPKPRVVEDVDVQLFPSEGQVAYLAAGLEDKLATIPTSKRKRAGGDEEIEFNQAAAPVATLTGAEFAEGITDLKDLRRAAIEYFRTELEGRLGSVERPGFGVVTFGKVGRDKVKDTSANPDKLRLIPAIPAIITRGRYDGRADVAAEARRDGIVAFHYFSADVTLGERTVHAGVSVGEDAHGNKFYNVNLDPSALKAKRKARVNPRTQKRGPEPSEGDVTLDQSIDPGRGGVNVEILDQENRGHIRFNRHDRQFKIHLGRRADPSTFLHESGHFFLEVFGDLVDELAAADPATLTQAQRKMLADYGAALQWLGVDRREDLGVDQHEQWARGFEAYLYEGHAPSAELRSLFAQFRAWLVGVYRTIRGLHVELSPEIRAVFDRMLATDDAIAAAREEAKVAPLFTDATSAGMTELEFASYQDTVREASQREQEELQARVLADLRREQQAWWHEERAAIRAEVQGEVYARPVYQAMSVIRTGALPDGTVPEQLDGAPVKLSRDSVRAEFGPGILKELPRPYLYARDTGITADHAASIFGFSSGDELLKAMIAAVPMRQAIEQETDARMFAKHGDVARDGRLAEEARRVVHGEHRQRVVFAELAALTKGLQRTMVPSADVINAAARQRIAATRIRDLRPGTFLMAAQRASRLAFDLKERDRAGAVRAKIQEAINLALYREARDAKERVDTMRRRLQGYGSTAARERFGKAGHDYLDQIDGFLDRYELARVSQKALDRRASLRAFVKKLEAEGLPVEIPDAVLDDARRVNYQDVSFEEFSGVHDAVEHIAHLARLKHALLKAAKKAAFDEVRNDLVSSILLNNEVNPQPLEFRPDDERRRGIGDWFAAHTKIATLARALDGHADGGAMWETIIRPINEASDQEQTRKAEAGRRLKALFDQAFPKRELGRLNDKLYIPAIGGSLSKEGRLAVALNWGNDGNRQRLLNDPTRRWNAAQVQAILDTLDERDWRFVQGVWDFIDSYWPEIAAKQQRVTGLAPEKVDAAPVDTRFGTFRGGYYPLNYDSRLVARAGAFAKGNEGDLVAAAGYVRATTRRGHTEARLDNVKMSVRLDFGVLYRHVDQVLHDLTHHEMLIDVSRMLGDVEVQEAILKTKGDLAYQQFTSALQDIALGAAPAKSVLDRSARFLRTRTQIALMGFSFWTGAQQPLGIFNGMQRVGVRWVARGMRRWLRDAASMESTVAWIHAVSPMMRERHLNGTQDLADLRSEIARPGGWFDELVRRVSRDTVTQKDITDSYLWHIGLMQRVADVPTWIGAYEKAMANEPDEARAIALADQAVLDSQGGGAIKDLAAVQRGPELAKVFMTFYSYGATLFNATADAYGRTNFRRAGSVGTFLGHLSLLYMMPALGTVTLARLFGKSDDDDSFLVEAGTEMLSAAMNTIVGLREFSGLLRDGVRGYAGPAGTRAIQVGYQVGTQIKQGEVDEGLGKAANQAAGILFRYPAQQVQRTVDGWVALSEGRTKNPAVLLVGAPKD